MLLFCFFVFYFVCLFALIDMKPQRYKNILITLFWGCVIVLVCCCEFENQKQRFYPSKYL